MTNEAIFSREAGCIINIKLGDNVIKAINKFKDKRKGASYQNALGALAA